MKPDHLSQTAAFIAIKFYGLTRMEPFKNWFDPEIIAFYEEAVSRLPAPLHLYHPLLRKSWARKFFIFSEELLLPGDLMHILARKYIIGQKVAELLSGRYDQLLVLGGGFDHLAAYHSERNIPSFETEPKGMARRKRSLLNDLGYRSECLHVIGITPPAGIGLQQVPSLDPNINTLVIAEGFFDYLSPSAARETVQTLKNFFRGELALLTTIFALDELPVTRRLVFKTSVTMVGESLRLHLSREAFGQMLMERGFQASSFLLGSRQIHRYLPSPDPFRLPMLEGFYITLYERE